MEATYFGGYRDYRPYLAPGERARIPVIAKDKDDAGQVRSFIEAILESEPWLLEREPKTDEIELTTGVDIVVKARSLTAGRSRAVPLAIYDEIAFWPSDGKVTDEEIIRGVANAMANIPDTLELFLSSPFAQAGELYKLFRDYYGTDGQDEVLVWKADTITMHDTPEIRQWADLQYRRDPVGAAAEVGADFRQDVTVFVSPEIVQACTDTGITERPPCSWAPVYGDGPVPQKNNYWAFVDPSGGSQDPMTLAIGHWDVGRKKAVVDVLHHTPAPLSPKRVTHEHCRILARYRVSHVTGDAYAGLWPREEYLAKLDAQGEHKPVIGYSVADRDKTALYKDVLPSLNAARKGEEIVPGLAPIALLDLPILADELCDLRRRVTLRGREVIDHQRDKHDDAANAVAGVLLLVLERGQYQEAPSADEAIPRDYAEALEKRHREEERVALEGPDGDEDPYEGMWIP